MTKRIPFDLDKALAGARVVTRDGRVPDEWHYFKTLKSKYPIKCVIEEDEHTFSKEGKFYFEGEAEHRLDLFLEIEEPEQWVNVYDSGVVGGVFSKKETAISSQADRYIATVPLSALIEWAKKYEEGV